MLKTKGQILPVTQDWSRLTSTTRHDQQEEHLVAEKGKCRHERFNPSAQVLEKERNRNFDWPKVAHMTPSENDV